MVHATNFRRTLDSHDIGYAATADSDIRCGRFYLGSGTTAQCKLCFVCRADYKWCNSDHNVVNTAMLEVYVAGAA